MDIIVAVLDLGSVLLLLILAIIARFNIIDASKQRPQPLFFGIGLISALFIVVLVIVMGDPWGLYETRHFVPQLLVTHPIKVNSYNNLPYDPEVVVLGSSRSFFVSGADVKRITGYSSFNAAVSSGGVADSFIFARYMALNSKRKFPYVLLIDLIPSREATSVGTQLWPPVVFPAMPYALAMTALGVRIEGLVSLNQFAGALSVIGRTILRKVPSEWTFDNPDGTASGTLLSQEDLDHTIDNAVTHHSRLISCNTVDPEVADYLQRLIDLAVKMHSSIVFYIPPVHPRYYEEFAASDISFKSCMAAYTMLMHDYQSKYPNVFFLDYIDPASIGAIGDYRGFYDYYHITTLNAELVLEKANETLHQAYAVAKTNRP